MLTNLIQLILLFLVIFDPLASLSVFLISTKHLSEKERLKVAILAILTAISISYSFLFFGEKLIVLFGSNIEDFKVASGIILIILGIKMVLSDISSIYPKSDDSSLAIASIIATPMLTGPAAITTIILSVSDPNYGPFLTGTAITIVLLLTSLIFILSNKFHKFINTTLINVLSTILGLITISWGVKYIRQGLGI